ncbi:MAG TPA: DUF4386 domain-containing protein [Jiangellaceae bacterium]|nr:DUF4386 domain-containing protein [Jiangellaceae bacterium]
MSPKTTGRIVGALFLLAFVVYLTGGALVDSGSGAPAALPDVVDHQTQIAAGALLMLVNSVVVVYIGVLVLPVLRPHHEISAYLYLAARIFEAVMLTVGILCLLLLIPLAQAHAEAGGDGSVLPTLAHVAQEGNTYALQLAMIGLGLGALPFCHALLRARLVPSFLAVWGLVGYGVLVAGFVLEVLGYSLGGMHMVLGGLFEVVLGVLLLVRGFPTRGDPRSIETTAAAVPTPHHMTGEAP